MQVCSPLAALSYDEAVAFPTQFLYCPLSKYFSHFQHYNVHHIKNRMESSTIGIKMASNI
jgi:hypothetical protein